MCGCVLLALFLYTCVCFGASSLGPTAPMVFVNILKFSQQDFQSDGRGLKPVKNLQCLHNIDRIGRTDYKQSIRRV